MTDTWSEKCSCEGKLVEYLIKGLYHQKKFLGICFFIKRPSVCLNTQTLFFMTNNDFQWKYGFWQIFHVFPTDP